MLEKGGLKGQMAALTDLGGARGAQSRSGWKLTESQPPCGRGRTSQTSLDITVMACYSLVDVNHIQLRGGHL